MNDLLWFSMFTAAAALALLAVYWFLAYRWNDTTETPFLIAFWAFVIVSVLSLFFGGVSELAAAVERSNCEGWADTTELDVRFERYSLWAWDCLVELDGVWVPRDVARIEP